MTLGFPLKQSQDVAEIVADTGENLIAILPRHRRAFRQLLAGAGDGETAVVKQALDFQNHLDIFTAVDAMPGFALLRRKARELAFPKAENEGFHPGEFAHFADLEKQFVRNCALHCPRH